MPAVFQALAPGGYAFFVGGLAYDKEDLERYGPVAWSADLERFTAFQKAGEPSSSPAAAEAGASEGARDREIVSAPGHSSFTDAEDRAAMDNVQTINRLSISFIEQRAATNANFGVFYNTKREHLKDILSEADQTVRHLGTTHKELGSHLKALVARALEFKSQTIIYDVAELPGNTLSPGKWPARICFFRYVDQRPSTVVISI